MGKKQIQTTSKLFKLKDWLTVPDAARSLTGLLEEEVSETDVLRLTLDGHLKLSVDFVNGATARCGKVVPYEDAEWYPPGYFAKMYPEKEKNELPPVMKDLVIDGERVLKLDKNIVHIRGIYDLPMFGAERLDVEHAYQNLTGGPEVTLTVLEGAFVEGQDGLMYQLQERNDIDLNGFFLAELEEIKNQIVNNEIDAKKANELLTQNKKNREMFVNRQKKKKPSDKYYPASALPHDSVLVVRAQALIDFQERLSQQESAKVKQLEPRSERTYLNIIGALLEVVTGNYKDENFSSEAKLREFIAEKFDGFRGVSSRTLAEKFALAKTALSGEMD